MSQLIENIAFIAILFLIVGLIGYLEKKFRTEKPELTPEETQKKLKEIAKAKREWEKRHKQKTQVETPKQNEKTHIPAHTITIEKPSTATAPETNFTNKQAWTLDLLMSLEWKRFEEVCKEYLMMTGHDARLTQLGADGGIDIKIYQNNQLVNIVQCKAWTWKISVKEIRELYGIMASEKVNEGLYITTSSFTQEAIIFSRDKNIRLVDGKGLIKQINYLPPQKQAILKNLATAGNYTTPTCPNCNIKMVKRTSRSSGNEFWGCGNFPQCRHRQQIRKAA